MADTQLASALEVEKWDSNYFAEYVRDSGFAPYMGTGTNSVIKVKEELVNEAGKTINIPLVTRLKGSGVTNDSTLEGNEEALGNYNWPVTISLLRHAVAVSQWQEKGTEIDLRNAARDMLKVWSMDTLRGGVTGQSIDGIVEALAAVYDGTTYDAYDANTSQTVLDAWLANNTDRVLYGAATSNRESDNDHSDSIVKVDATNDKLTPEAISLMKRLAKSADPHIRPLRVAGGYENFVMFTGSRAFRDLKQNSTMTQANREARERGVGSNPLFLDGDLIWDGVIVREVPEIGVIADVGASTIDVQPAYLCGQEAISLAWGQRPSTRTRDFDYGHRKGVAIQEMRGVKKNYFNNVQHGVVTGFFAGVAD